MATRFVQAATEQIAPAYQQQTEALQAQIPAIQGLYAGLIGGLGNQQRVENQNILEGASSRGILRSTIPVDAQTALAQAFTQKRGELAGQQAREFAGIQGQMGQIGVERARAITDLATALESQDIQRRQAELDYAFQQQKLAQERALQEQALAQQRAIADRQYQLARRGR